MYQVLSRLLVASEPRPYSHWDLETFLETNKLRRSGRLLTSHECQPPRTMDEERQLEKDNGRRTREEGQWSWDELEPMGFAGPSAATVLVSGVSRGRDSLWDGTSVTNRASTRKTVYPEQESECDSSPLEYASHSWTCNGAAAKSVACDDFVSKACHTARWLARGCVLMYDWTTRNLLGQSARKNQSEPPFPRGPKHWQRYKWYDTYSPLTYWWQQKKPPPTGYIYILRVYIYRYIQRK